MYKPGFLKREVIVFRQFKRKGWALFACLGREVVISVLSVATLSSTKAACISNMMWRADTAQVPKEIWLGDVGVTGSRAPLTQSQAARMVTVLSHDDIAQAAVQSVNDLLKLAVGVDVRQRGALRRIRTGHRQPDDAAPDGAKESSRRSASCGIHGPALFYRRTDADPG